MTSPIESELLAAVLAAPGDLAPRAVYADWLSDQGDPRGEFIGLQLEELRRALTGPERARARKLQKAHQRQWLGPLGAVLTDTSFRGGFLDRAALRPAGAASASGWEEAAASPLLATGRALFQGQGTAAHYTRMLTSPHARGLVRAEIPNIEALRVLLFGPPRAFERLGAWRILLATEVQADAWRRTFPRLARLDVELPGLEGPHRWALGRLRGHGIFEGLGHLCVSAPSHGYPWAPIRDAVAELFIPGSMERLELRVHRLGITFWREGSALHARLVDPEGAGWSLIANELPPLASLELVLPASLTELVPDPEVALESLRRTGVQVTVRRADRSEVAALLD